MSGILALIITYLIWGAAPPVFKYALQDIPPFILVVVRFIGAGLILLPLAIKHFPKIITKEEWKIIFLGGFWGVTINVSTFFIGLEFAPSINVHIISAAGPILLYFLSIFILKEKPHAHILKGMIISLFGVLLIVFAPLIQSGTTHSVNEYTAISILIGNIFYIISMIGATMISVYNKKISQSINPLVFTPIQFFSGALPLIPLALYELRSWSFSQLTVEGAVGIIYGLFFSSALAYFAMNYALSKMDAQKTGIYAYMMPIVAVVVAIPLLGEYPDIFFIVGAVLVFIGIIFSERHPHYKKMHRKIYQ